MNTELEPLSDEVIGKVADWVTEVSTSFSVNQLLRVTNFITAHAAFVYRCTPEQTTIDAINEVIDYEKFYSLCGQDLNAAFGCESIGANSVKTIAETCLWWLAYEQNNGITADSNSVLYSLNTLVGTPIA